MNLKTYGHATLSFEKDEKPILITDPWLIGSCYWRSWWLQHYPNELELDKLKNTKNIYKISESLKIKDYLILVFENKKNISLEKKILFLSSFLEIANNSKIKNKIFICNVVKSKNLNNFNKLEKNIFIEIINSFNNMFSLNLIFSNYVNKEKTISFIKILKEFKIYN